MHAILVDAGGEPSDAADVRRHAAEDCDAAGASGIGGPQCAADFGDEIGMAGIDKCLKIRSEKRRFRMFYANARQNWPLRGRGKPYGLKTELEHFV